MENAATTSWSLPDQRPSVAGNRSEKDIQEWQELNQRVVELARANGWSKADVAKRAGMPDGTFSQWQSGKYEGRLDNQNERIRNWLESVEEVEGIAATIPVSPGFVLTRSAQDIMNTLGYAQMAPGMVIVTLGAGMGKTATCRHYCETRPNSYLVTVSPHTKTVHGMLVELASELDIVQHNPAKLSRAIRERLKRVGAGTLLIVDEAQNLKDDAIDQLRQLVDLAQCGVALVGNSEIYGRFHKSSEGPSYAQIKRRVSLRLKRDRPFPEDISAVLDAWQIEDLDCRKFLTGIGLKAGAIGQIDETLKIAHMLAAGSRQPVTARLLKAAWSNRDMGASQ